MVRRSVVRAFGIGVVLAALGVASSAFAQAQGAIQGRVLDEKGKMVVGAEVVITNVDTPQRAKPVDVLTDNDGLWSMANLPAGKYMVEVRKGNLVGAIKSAATIRPNDMTNTGDLTIKAVAAAGGKQVTEADVKAIQAKNDRAAKQQAALAAADAAVAAGSFDDAIAKLTEVSGLIDNCGACYTKIGIIYLENKKDEANAEQAFLKAIDLNDKLVSDPKTKAVDDKNKAIPYQRLQGIYNDQKKFDDAAKMAAKANDLLEATGAGGDPISIYNQGISLWNAGKMPEAQAAFEKVIKLNPKYAEAYYQLGMTLVNQNKLPDAKPQFEQYLKLAPTGPNAGTAKAILDSIK